MRGKPGYKGKDLTFESCRKVESGKREDKKVKSTLCSFLVQARVDLLDSAAREREKWISQK